MSNPRKPEHLKALSGTTRPDRATVTVLSTERLTVTPEAPGWLPNDHAIREWSVLAPRMVACAILTPDMVAPLGHLCALHGMLCASWIQKKPPNAATITAYRQLAAAFGLTPADASKVTKPPRGSPNAFRRLRGRGNE
jgi:hypothetical protein